MFSIKKILLLLAAILVLGIISNLYTENKFVEWIMSLKAFNNIQDEPRVSNDHPLLLEYDKKTYKLTVESDNSYTRVRKEPFLIYIDPGHQERGNYEQEPIGPGSLETKYKVTSGTTGVVTEKPEYVLVLEASIILKELLERRGFSVILTRDTHNVDISNKERAEMANEVNADLFVRLHADGSENANHRGFSILTPSKDNPYLKVDVIEDSLLASSMILNQVEEGSITLVIGNLMRDDLSGFNWSEVPVILPELGFMTNPEEDQNLSNTEYLTDLLNLIANGIEEFAKYKEDS